MWNYLAGWRLGYNWTSVDYYNMLTVQPVEIRSKKTDVEKQYNNQVVIFTGWVTKRKTINCQKTLFPRTSHSQSCKCQPVCLHMSDNQSTHLTPRHAGGDGGGGGGEAILLPSSYIITIRQVLPLYWVSNWQGSLFPFLLRLIKI